MAEVENPIEQSLAKKLKLDEYTLAEHIPVLLNFFKKILDGDIKTAPLELKALLNLIAKKQGDDKTDEVSKFLAKHQINIKVFFRVNFQKFDYYEFKPLLQKIYTFTSSSIQRTKTIRNN